MASSTKWTCNGIPQNGKEYNGLGGKHESRDNYALDCEICGLPQESSIPQSKSSFTAPKALITLVLTGIVILIGSGTTYYAVIKNRCEPGLEKIDGQCIDPFLQPYQEATQKGDEAIAIANNYKSIENLEKAQTILTDVFTQISQIPSEALIYPEVKAKSEEYKAKREEINSKIQKEKIAQAKLQEIETIAQTAKDQTKTATTNPQLTAIQQKWQEALNKLQEIDSNTLVGNQIKQYQSDCEKQIQEIDRRIASIASQSQPRPQVSTYYPTRTPITNTFTPATSIRKSPAPATVKSTVKSTTPQPEAIPLDICAVEPKPTNCRF
jgi:hypothetical protein